MTEPRLSYTGERVYVGIDVHKATYTVVCVCQRRIVKTATVPADPAQFAASVLRWFPGATLASAYEAGFSGFVLHRVLTTAGLTNLVVNPASVAVAANDRVQNGSPGRQETGPGAGGRALTWHPYPHGSRGTGPAPPTHPCTDCRAPRHAGPPDQ